jgi:NADPH2:quinone reductase
MPGAIRVQQTGGPDVLTYVEVDVPDPGPGEVRIRHHACGVNFIDVYYRTGLYAPPGGLPFVIGAEGAGEVVAVGPGVSTVSEGDRVAYSGNIGSYAVERIYPAD